MSRRRRSRSQPVAFKIGASAVLFGLAMISAELVARTIDLDSPRWRSEGPNTVIMVGHHSRLWGMREGVRSNAGTTATINADGLRGEVPASPRPEGTERIMVLGDSTFFGHGVADDETMPARIQTELTARSINVEAINGAVPGYSTEQTLLLLKDHGWSYEPTMLLIGNLWSDNNVDGFRDADLLRTVSIYDQHVLGKSSFYRLLVAGIDKLRSDESARMVTWTTTSEWPAEGSRRVSLKRYARNLDRMVRDAKERGCGAAFIAPANDGLVSERFRGTAGWDPYFDAQRRVAAHHGLPIVSGLDALQAEAAENGKGGLFIDEMHPTARGHQALGRAVADALVEAGWPENRLLGSEALFDDSVLSNQGIEMSAYNDPSRSPQAQLFASSEPVANAARHGPEYPSSEDGTWTIQGSLQGGTPPYHIRVVTREGLTLAFQDKESAGPFRVAVPAGTDDVDVIVSGVNGGETRMTATPNDNTPVLVLPIGQAPGLPPGQ
jgi:hypothetical protein